MRFPAVIWRVALARRQIDSATQLALLQELNAPLYRWPGGNFVSGYEWRDGVGDRDRRPPRKNPAWTGVEHNDFGSDEFLRFCRALGAEPMIVVNTGFGDAHSAAAWVEHCRGAVRWWSATNVGAWRLRFIQLALVQKHNQVAGRCARWIRDQLVAVGDLGASTRSTTWAGGAVVRGMPGVRGT
jgi:alpha-N-arabinofuranosidase